MKKLHKNIIYAVLAIVLIIVLIFIFTPNKTDTANDALAQYLTAQGAVMYGTEWCPHCQAQKKLFGDSFIYINYVDCDRQPDECSAAGVEGYPTWVINGTSYPGQMSLERLASLAGYKPNVNSS